MANNRWLPRSPRQGHRPVEIESWARQLEISDFLCALLWERGLSNPQEMDTFLSPGLRHLAPLGSWPGLEQASTVLAQGLESFGQIAVWGDYDVDGITSTALVADVLRQRGYSVVTFLPQRLRDGYGLNCQGIESLFEQGIRVLLTVDCGMGSHQALARAKELGMRVVVSDHHQPGLSPPPAEAIVNPQVDTCPCSDLAGVGTAFFLMAALNKSLPGRPVDLRQVLDLVALGTIADVVKLNGQNRILTKNGLLLLSEAKRPGIQALKEVSGLPAKAPIGAGHVAFGLAPRLNAAGRMDTPDQALELLLTSEISQARALAAKLEAANQDRKGFENQALEQALSLIDPQDLPTGLVLSAPDWHQGVIGIVASRVVEQFYRPTILLTRHNGYWKGSGRGIGEVDIYTALGKCADLLSDYGGHPQAAGLSLSEDNLQAFAKRFDRAVAEQLKGQAPCPRMYMDGELDFGQIDLTLIQEIELLQPFGLGNPQPVFCSKRLKVKRHKVFGKDHVSLRLHEVDSGITLNGKAWRRAKDLQPNILDQQVRLLFTPRLNHYQGLTSIDLDLKDWQPIP